MHSISSLNFFLRPWCTSTPSYSNGARFCVLLRNSFMGFFWREAFFSTDDTKKLILTFLRLETGSNIYYFWCFTMHSISSLNFFLRPWCTSTPSYSNGARFCVLLRNSFIGFFWREAFFFTDDTKKLILTFLRLETGSNIYYLWCFTMHSISSSNFFLRPWCSSTPFLSKTAW